MKKANPNYIFLQQLFVISIFYIVIIFTNKALAEDNNLDKQPKILSLNLESLPGESSTVEMQIRKLTHSLMSVFKNQNGSGRFYYIAMVPFKESGEHTQKKDLGSIVTAEISTYLRKDHGIKVTSNDNMIQALKQLKVQRTGAFNEKTIVDIGKFVGAQVLITGSVSEVSDKFIIYTKMVSVKTAETLSSEKITVKNKDLIAFSDNSIVLRTTSGAMFRSALIPGWGQIYNKEPLKGYGVLAVESSILLAALTFQLLGARSESLYYDGKPNTVNEHDIGEKYYKTREILVYSAIVVWAYNLFDSYMGAQDLKKKR